MSKKNLRVICDSKILLKFETTGFLVLGKKACHSQ